MRKIVLFTFLELVILNIASAQSGCNNVGFETGTTAGWVCKYGSYGTGPCPPVGNCPEFLFNFNHVGCLDSAGIDCSLYGNDRHCIIDLNCSGSCRDTNIFFSFVSPLITGNQFSFRLGNAIAGGIDSTPDYAQAEAIRYTFVVDTQNAGFTYYYAVFIQDTFHEPESGPRFEVTLYDSANNELPCGHYLVVGGTTPSHCGINTTFHQGDGLWRYSDWASVDLDLTSYIGHPVSIEFRTADCYEKDTGTCNYHPGSHSAYAYIDAQCNPSPLLGYNPFALVSCGSPATICAPAGYRQYQWFPFGDTTECITVNNPYSGEVLTVYLYPVTGCMDSVYITLECLFGVNEIINDNTISVFPNPANSKITVKFNESINDLTLSIFNPLGSNVITKEIDKNSETTIDVSQFPKGVYLIRLVSEDQLIGHNKLIVVGN